MSEKAEVYWCKDCTSWTGLVGSYNAPLDKYTCVECYTPLDTFVAITPAELAALTSERDRLREAAQQANKELRRKLKDGEVVYNVLYSAQEILTAALDKDAKG